MNPVDAVIVRLGAYIARLEAELQQAHETLAKAAKEIEGLKAETKTDG